MCGIAAIFSYSPDAPPIDRDELLAIRNQITKRGPDGAGLWISQDGRVGLAHRRLTISKLSEAGTKSMFTADGPLSPQQRSAL
jgi:asparagine synthase (glutamine-hydrolysing)